MLDVYAINLAIEVLLLSGSNDLFIGFNSLNAYASVNHLHLHAYYMANKVSASRAPNLYAFPVQNIKVSQSRICKSFNTCSS